MTRMVQALSVVQAAVAAIGPFLAHVLNAYVLNMPMPEWALLLFAVPASILLSLLARMVFSEWLRRCSTLKRLLLGSQHVDGTWVQAIMTDKDRVIAVGIKRFNTEATGLQFFGENFDYGLRSRSTFRSRSSNLQWPRLDFESENNSPLAVNVSRGLGHYQFIVTDGRPVRLTGTFKLVEADDFFPAGRTLRVEAIRLLDSDEVESLADHERRRAVISRCLVRMLGREAATAALDRSEVGKQGASAPADAR